MIFQYKAASVRGVLAQRKTTLEVMTREEIAFQPLLIAYIWRELHRVIKIVRLNREEV